MSVARWFATWKRASALRAGHFLCWPKESNQRKGQEKPRDKTAIWPMPALRIFVADHLLVFGPKLGRRTRRTPLRWTACFALLCGQEMWATPALAKQTSKRQKLEWATAKETQAGVLTSAPSQTRLQALSLVTFFGPAKKVTRAPARKRLSMSQTTAQLT